MSITGIKQHMAVVANDGQHVGTVDRVDGDEIRLTKTDENAGGQHHLIPTSWVDVVEDGQVKLSKTFGDALQNWKPAG